MNKQRKAPGDLERVRRFVNTLQVGRATDLLSNTAEIAEWFAHEGLAPAGLRVTRAEASRVIEMRAALRAVLTVHNAGGDGAGVVPKEARRVLDAAASRARLRLRFADDGNAALVPETGGVSGALGRLLAIVNDSIAEGTWSRLKACRDDDCAWAFYDHTKNRSGAWCSMERCGNRAKARAYRDRHATPAR
jgi:predicted RNA-binding Zn ribbon-like protein